MLSGRALGLAACAVTAAAALSGCGSGGHAAATSAKLRRAGGGIPAALAAGERPIGRGARYQPPDSGPVLGACRAPLGRRIEAHVEVFGNDRVVLLAAGIGTRAPRRFLDARLTSARCFGSLVTLDPTGIVYLRPGATLTLGDLFRSWGQPLSATRVASFSGGTVRVYVDGRMRHGSPGSTPLSAGAEVVVEVGPYVPPHSRFVFPQEPVASTR